MTRVPLIAVAFLALAGCNKDARDAELLGTLERERLELTAEAHEPVVSIDVREGEHVAEGARLLTLQLGTMQARLDQATAGTAAATQRLNELASS